MFNYLSVVGDSIKNFVAYCFALHGFSSHNSIIKFPSSNYLFDNSFHISFDISNFSMRDVISNKILLV